MGAQTLQPINYLVMWSGGIDSTYTLAKLLKETNHKIFVHHICLVNFEKRAHEEQLAIKKLGPKLHEIRPFHYSETLVDQSKMPMITYDMAEVCFRAGAVSKALWHGLNIHLDKWTIGTHKAEGHNWERWEIIKHATRAAEWTKGREKFIEFELQPMVSKREEMDYLADLGLLKDCWCCRTPREGKPCNACKTCKEVEAAWQSTGSIGTIKRIIKGEDYGDNSIRG